MYSITAYECLILEEIKGIVLDDKRRSYSLILKKCIEISSLIDDTRFPFIYAATLCASEGHIALADKVFAHCSQKNPFVSVMRTYLKKYGKLTPRVRVFEDTSPYTAWTKTNIAQSYMLGVTKTITQFFVDTFDENKNEIRVLDIGTGNGILLTEIINKIIEQRKIKFVHLILLDMSEDMIDTAKKYCFANINAELNITEICCKINKISNIDLQKIRSIGKLDFINCALSIHHFSCDQKIRVLHLLNTLSEYCIISEVNFNHDIPEKYSPELIYAVYINMSYIFGDTLNSNLSEVEKNIALEHFFLAEAINIITKDRLERIDYHTKIRNWKRLAEEAGFNILKTVPIVKTTDGNRIGVFSMILN